MHVEENILEFDFEGRDPTGVESKLKRNTELVMPFLHYMMRIEMGGEEYNKYKTYWNRGRDMKAGYCQALNDMWDFWNENKAAIRAFKLSGYDGVEFLINKLIEKKHELFYLGRNLDIKFTEKEMQEFRDRKNRKKRAAGTNKNIKG